MVKKWAALAAGILFLISLVGCSSQKFSNETELNEISSTKEISLSVKEQSLTDTGLILLIENHTDKECSYGMEYTVEQKRGDKWYSSDEEKIVESLAALLRPNETNEFSVTWKEKLPPGTYRVVKPVNTSKGNENLAVEFTVQ